MKDYVKPCIRKKNPNYLILHVRTTELNPKLPPGRIAKSISVLLKTLNQTVE